MCYAYSIEHGLNAEQQLVLLVTKAIMCRMLMNCHHYPHTAMKPDGNVCLNVSLCLCTNGLVLS